MRGTVESFESRHPLGFMLPALLQEDDFAQRLCRGLDVVLASTLSTLDNLDAYVDPDLAPTDFLAWLATWVGDDVVPGRRPAVAGAVERHRWRGTAAGVRAAIESVTGVGCDVSDGGGVAWSAAPGTALPGDGAAGVVVTVPENVTDSGVDLDLVLRVARDVVPAWVPVRVEMAP